MSKTETAYQSWRGDSPAFYMSTITLRTICVSSALFALFTIINHAKNFGGLAALQSLDMLMITLFFSVISCLVKGIPLLFITALAALTCQIV